MANSFGEIHICVLLGLPKIHLTDVSQFSKTFEKIAYVYVK